MWFVASCCLTIFFHLETIPRVGIFFILDLFQFFLHFRSYVFSFYFLHTRTFTHFIEEIGCRWTAHSCLKWKLWAFYLIFIAPNRSAKIMECFGLPWGKSVFMHIQLLLLFFVVLLLLFISLAFFSCHFIFRNAPTSLLFKRLRFIVRLLLPLMLSWLNDVICRLFLTLGSRSWL